MFCNILDRQPNFKFGKEVNLKIWWFRLIITEFKNLIIKNLQKSDHKLLEQYRRRNNIEINRFHDSIPDLNLEQKVIEILNEIDVSV